MLHQHQSGALLSPSSEQNIREREGKKPLAALDSDRLQSSRHLCSKFPVKVKSFLGSQNFNLTRIES